MSGMDREQFNLDERATSTDINTLQDLIHRSVLDAMRYMFSQPTYGALGAGLSSSVRAVVLGGLEVTPSGNDVLVQPGVLLQDSAGLAPVPGTLDSNYRIGIARTPVVVTMPSPGAQSWLIVEAQMVEVVVETRTVDIWDPTTQTYSGQSKTKRAERRLQFQATAAQAGSVPAFTGGDWIPLAIVRRPGGGGAVATTDIYDVRPIWAERMAGCQEFPALLSAQGGGRNVRMWTEGMAGTTSNNVRVEYAEALSRRGERLWLQSNVNIDISAAPFLQNGLVLAGDTWYYLYIAPWRTVGVRNWSSLVQGNGLLVLSSVSPDRAGYNLAQITPGAPFSSTPIDIGEAVCIAAVRRNSLNTGWGGTYTADGHLFRCSQSGAVNVTTLSPPAASQSINMTTPIPAGVRTVILALQWVGAAGAHAERQASIDPSGASAMQLDHIRLFDDWSGVTNQIAFFEVPVQALGSNTIDLTITGGAINAGTVLSINLVGWRQ